MNPQQFIEALKEHGIELTDEQIGQFDKYYEMLVHWNEKINLTAVTEKEEVYLKHFYDSLTPLFYTDIPEGTDRKSTRLNSSHVASSYAVFCLKTKKITT